MDAFQIRLNERNPRVAVGQSVDFWVYFSTITDSSQNFQRNPRSVYIQYGDGTGDDTGLQTLDPSYTGDSGVFTHVYKKPGTFTASVKGGEELIRAPSNPGSPPSR